MREYLQLDQLDLWVFNALFVDLAVALALIVALRFLFGLVANVHTGDELSERDNAAFGLSFTGGLLGLALMLTGAVSGDAANNLLTEAISVATFGALGLVLIKVGRRIQDKLVLTNIAIDEQINQGNLSAAIVDMANSLAIGLVLRSVMLWVESDAVEGLIVVLIAFLAVQLLLAVTIRLRLAMYAKRHPEGCLQEAFAQGNIAIALRYLGQLMGVALAMTAASGMIIYNHDHLLAALVAWLIVTLILSFIVALLAEIARKVVLMGIDVIEEVDQQKNVAVGAIEAALYITIGLLMTALFG